MIHVAYDDRLLGWRLGKNHPSDPVRAKNAIEMLESWVGDVKVHPISGPAAVSLLEEVHQPAYVTNTLSGRNDEWTGERTDLATVARLMFQGTVDMTWRLEGARKPGVYFSPQGAKHHAMYAQGSGFCVFNDMAWAAQYLSRRGHRVLYVDTDAHHGDGVEALTYGNTDIMTCSIHDSTIFPGTGHGDVEGQRVYNWPLAAKSGDAELVASVEEALSFAESFDPTVVLVAVGGDGHTDDPLSTLQYTLNGYSAIGVEVGSFAAKRRASVLIGGAGGYRPHGATPLSWATFVAECDGALQAGVQTAEFMIQ